MEARLAEMERLQAGRGDVGGRFWDRRARSFARGPMGSAEGDPMMSRLRRAVGRGGTSTVLDVGSGPGRFALAIAPRARHVTALDPSPKMLALLRRRAREAGITNVRTVVGSWPGTGVDPGDVVLCAHVLPLVADAPAFVRALGAAARRRVLLYVGAYAADALLDPFWRHFHGSPRAPGASYLDALAVLEEEGIRARVEVVEVRAWSRHADLREAVAVYRDQLVLPRRREVDRELARLLEPWLQPSRDGLRAPVRTLPAAVITWEP